MEVNLCLHQHAHDVGSVLHTPQIRRGQHRDEVAAGAGDLARYDFLALFVMQPRRRRFERLYETA